MRRILLLLSLLLFWGEHAHAQADFLQQVNIDTLGLEQPEQIEIRKGLLIRGKSVNETARAGIAWLDRLDSLRRYAPLDTAGYAQLLDSAWVLLDRVSESLSGRYPSELSEQELTQVGRRLRGKLLFRLQQAVDAFQQALVLQPRNDDLQQNMAACLVDMAQLYRSLDQYEAAVEAYQRLAELNPDDYFHLWDIADMYHRMGWDSQALDYYRRAEDLLVESFVFSDTLGQGLPTLDQLPERERRYWYFLVQSQADMEIELHLSANARINLDRALIIAPASERQQIIGTLSWMEEFGFQVEQNEQYNRIQEHLKRKEWLPAAALLNDMSRRPLPVRTRCHVLNSLAELKFYHLGQELSAIATMEQVLALGEGELPDSLLTHYSDNLGYMAYRSGVKKRLTDPRDAARLFTIGSERPGSWRAVNYLELATLYTTRPEKVLELVDLALEDELSMERRDLRTAYQLLNEAYRQRGEMALAREAYQKFLELKE